MDMIALKVGLILEKSNLLRNGKTNMRICKKTPKIISCVAFLEKLYGYTRKINEIKLI